MDSYRVKHKVIRNTESFVLHLIRPVEKLVALTNNPTKSWKFQV